MSYAIDISVMEVIIGGGGKGSRQFLVELAVLANAVSCGDFFTTDLLKIFEIVIERVDWPAHNLS